MDTSKAILEKAFPIFWAFFAQIGFLLEIGHTGF
jgi:hypothetical protein